MLAMSFLHNTLMESFVGVVILEQILASEELRLKSIFAYIQTYTLC